MLFKGVGNVHGGCSCRHWWVCCVAMQLPELGCAVAVSSPRDSVWVTIIPVLCSHSWLGEPRGTGGKIFRSTWMAWSALCHFRAWLTCSGAAVCRVNGFCLPVQSTASENVTIKNPAWRRLAWFIRLWWFLFAFLLFFLLPNHSNLNFWTIPLLSTLNFCHASHPAQLLSV